MYHLSGSYQALLYSVIVLCGMEGRFNCCCYSEGFNVVWIFKWNTMEKSEDLMVQVFDFEQARREFSVTVHFYSDLVLANNVRLQVLHFHVSPSGWYELHIAGPSMNRPICKIRDEFG